MQLTSSWQFTGVSTRSDDDVADAGDRKQELFVVVDAALGRAEGQRHPVRGGLHPALHRRSRGQAAHLSMSARAGKVPVLVDGDITVWDSLAIIEYVAERFPEAKLWPDDRRRARPCAFGVAPRCIPASWPLRNECGMNLHRPVKRQDAVGRRQGQYRAHPADLGRMPRRVTARLGRICSAPSALRMRCTRRSCTGSCTYAIECHAGERAYMETMHGAAGVPGMDPGRARRNACHRKVRERVVANVIEHGLTARRMAALNRSGATA